VCEMLNENWYTEPVEVRAKFKL